MIKEKKENKPVNEGEPTSKVVLDESGATLKDLVEKNIKW